MVFKVSVRQRARLATLSTILRILVASLVATAVGGTSFAQAPVPAQVPAAAPAQRANQLAVWAGYGDSDNIGRTVTPVEGTYRSLGLFLGLMRQTTRLDADINSDIEYRTYTDDLFDSETVGALSARALIDAVVDRFAWNFQGNIDQGQQDPFAARGPNNRETMTYLTTGPRLDVPFGRTSLMITANRSARRFEESVQVDNDTDDYQIALSRLVRPTTVLGLVAGAAETDYEDGLTPSFKIEQLFLRANKTLQNGMLAVDVGTNEVSSDLQSRRDPLLDFSWNRSLATRSTLGITAAQRFTGTGDMGIGGTAFVTTAPFEQESIGVTYGFAGERTDVTMGVAAGEEDYAGGTTLDNDYESSTFTVSYRAATRLDLGFRYQRYDREFVDTAQSQGDRTAGLWLNRTLGRRFSIALDVSRYEADGVQPVDETRTEIRFAYSPTGDTATALAGVGR
jgi:hypothetical protein